MAMQGGVYAAQVILRHVHGQAPPSPFIYRNKGNMAIIGRGFAIADFGWTQLSGLIAWFAWLFIHIFMLIGFRNRLSVMIQWATSFITLQRSVRLITFDSSAGRD